MMARLPRCLGAPGRVHPLAQAGAARHCSHGCEGGGHHLACDRSLVVNSRRSMASIILATAGQVSRRTVSMPLASKIGVACGRGARDGG